MASIDKHGVMDHNMTLAEIKSKHGVDKPAVGLRLLFTVKLKPNGELDKYKVRMVVQGHSGNMQRNVHLGHRLCLRPSSGPWCARPRGKP